MLHNYHTHTFRNHHTIGTEREYIESAIKNGFRTLGFSEHAPYRFPDGYISYFHMFPEDLENYIQTLLALKAEYAGRIEILIGYEAEFYPRFFDDFLRRITQYPVDYLLLGQHFLGNEQNAPYACRRTKDESFFAAYVDQVCEGIRTGAFTYLAHPDLVCFDGDDATFRRHALRLCECAAETDTPLEINMLGLWDHRHYPSERFFKLAGEVGNKVVFGVDAHQPERIVEPDVLKRANELAEKCGIAPVERIPYHSPNR